MSPSISAIVIGAASLLFLLRIRSLWLNYQIEAYTFASGFYTLQTKQPEHVLEEMQELWPTRYMLWELWRWDFSRYVVHTAHYDDLQEWLTAELLKEDTIEDLVKLNAELDDRAKNAAREQYEKDIADDNVNR